MAQQREQSAVRVSFLPPARALVRYIDAYYVMEVRGPPATDLLHPEWGNLRFLLTAEHSWRVGDANGMLVEAPRAALFGPTSRARVMEASTGLCMGVGLTPLGWAVLVGEEASATADRVVPADAVLGASIPSIHEALCHARDDPARAAVLDAWLLERAAGSRAPRVDVEALTGLLAEPAIRSVGELAAAAGLTTVTLSRACLRYFGFMPKLLLRRQRFLRTLAKAFEERGRLRYALDPCYVDQSHFNRDFREFMGDAPGRYFSRHHPILDAAARARRAALGASVQGLHVAA